MILKNFRVIILFNLLLFLLIVFLDQFTKRMLLSEIGLNRSSPFIPGIVQFTVVQNTGGAFSIFKEYPEFFKVIGLINVILFSYFAFCPTLTLHFIVRLGSACILGGTFGNLIDRFTNSAVIDFLDLEFVNFAVFNLADVFINIGVGLIIIGWFVCRGKACPCPKT